MSVINIQWTRNHREGPLSLRDLTGTLIPLQAKTLYKRTTQMELQ